MDTHGTALDRRVSLESILYGPRCVVELGAHSLEFHRLQCGNIHTVKFPYALGHEVYSTGLIREPTFRRIIDLVPRNILAPALAIGTSAVRDAGNRREFVDLLEDELDLGVHVLSSWEEAALLAEGYLAASEKLPALVAGLGGGSLEIVSLSKAKAILWDSLNLGAIRLYHLGGRNGRGARNAQLASIEEEFLKATIVDADEVHATGGTASAIARTLGKSTLSRTELRDLERVVRRKGPPSKLEPQRARVFHSGLLLMNELLDLAGARSLTCMRISIGRIFLAFARTCVQPESN